MVTFVEKNDYKLQGKFVMNITKVNKAILKFENVDFWDGITRNKNVFSLNEWPVVKM